MSLLDAMLEGGQPSYSEKASGTAGVGEMSPASHLCL